MYTTKGSRRFNDLSLAGSVVIVQFLEGKEIGCAYNKVEATLVIAGVRAFVDLEYHCNGDSSNSIREG